ncbi:MAG: cytochrome, partial [Renibacterium salmoninarum]|nr:cytochrome [Renibacterium salmoninarum]
MTQPALAHATDFGRMYARSLAEAPSVPSITTVIGLQAIDLDGWIGYMAAKALADHPGLPEAAGR